MAGATVTAFQHNGNMHTRFDIHFVGPCWTMLHLKSVPAEGATQSSPAPNMYPGTLHTSEWPSACLLCMRASST